MKSKLAFALLAALFLSSCRDWNPSPPPHTQLGEPTVIQSPSTIRVAISANTANIAHAVLTEYANKTLSSGRSDEISAQLLVEQKITSAKAQQILVTAAVPGACEVKQVPRQIKTGTKCVAQALGCVVKLFHKCGQVCTDVLSTVFDSVKTCAADQAAVYRTEMTPVVNLVQATVPTSIWINHDVRLQDLQLNVAGSHVSVSATLPINISVDVKQGVLGANINVKGALSCDALVAVASEGEIHLSPDRKVNVTLSDFSMDWKKLCIPGAVQALDMSKYLNLVVLLSSGELKNVVNKAIVGKLNEALQRAANGPLDFDAAITKVGIELQAPHAVRSDATLLIHPNRFFASDFAGVGSGAANEIQMTIGVEAKPEVVMGPVPAQPAPSALPFTLAGAGAGFFIDARGSVALSLAEAKLKTLINDFLNQKFGDKNIQASDVNLYQSGANLTIAVKVERKGGIFKDVGTIYLLAQPNLSVDGTTIGLTHIHFDADTRIVMLKFAAWFLDGRIETYLEQKAKFPVGGQLNAVASKLSTFSVPTANGVLSGTVSVVKPEGIWVANGSLWVAAMASGDASFAFTPSSLLH